MLPQIPALGGAMEETWTGGSEHRLLSGFTINLPHLDRHRGIRVGIPPRPAARGASAQLGKQEDRVRRAGVSQVWKTKVH